MKKKDLERRLRAKGARFLGQGTRHEKWISAKGYHFTVPRHTEIKEAEAWGILDQADK